MLRIDYLAIGGLPPLSFEVASGECMAVEGPSGSGKTRLLRAIADLDPAEGYVYFEGQERRELPGPQWRARVRYVAAEPAWWATLTREHFKSPETLDRLMMELGLDAGLLDRPVAQLSTGERQRFGLIRALADDPPVLLLDEPTSALDARNGALVETLIASRVQAGCIVILVSHDGAQVERLAHARLQLARSGSAGGARSVAA